MVWDGDVDLVGNVALGGDVNSEGRNPWRWTNGAVDRNCCVVQDRVYTMRRFTGFVVIDGDDGVGKMWGNSGISF